MGLLSGIRIVDFSRLLPGAALTQLLADMGADVIKIERPGAGDDIRRAGPEMNGSSAVHLFLDRGKRSVALDLKTASGVAAAVRIAATADAVVESFRPGAADQLGLSYEALSEHNPKLVYVSLNGYGDTGPRSLAAGHDLNYCAYAGILDFSGWEQDGPRPSGAQVADVTGGTLGAVGLLAAVLSASRTGRGARISVALADAALWTVGIHVSAFLAGGPQGSRSGDLNGGLPCYDVYECADGRYIAVGALEPKFWQALVHGLNRPDLAERQYDRVGRFRVARFVSVAAARALDRVARGVRRVRRPGPALRRVDGGPAVRGQRHVHRGAGRLGADHPGRRAVPLAGNRRSGALGPGRGRRAHGRGAGGVWRRRPPPPHLTFNRSFGWMRS